MLVAVTFGALAQGQRIGERRRVRLRGRTRASASRAINSPLPVIQQVQPVPALSCPQPEGLQVYPDPTSCNRFYKVRFKKFKHPYELKKLYIYIYTYISMYQHTFFTITVRQWYINTRNM